jgi:uncharacterized protein YlzI (FlbEa/FlbD family)
LGLSAIESLVRDIPDLIQGYSLRCSYLSLVDMNDFQAPESSEIVPHQSNAIVPLDEFKSFFYQLNAKPDTEIRLLPGKKILGLADIRSINERVDAKLRNHDITAEITAINFVLSDRKVKDYSTWAEFERENWDTVNEKVQTLTIKWDILIKLPTYQLPQRHSMKLRIGADIPPRDMIQLILTSDDITQLIEAKTPSVCKVDFVNNIIAIELLNIVSNWHEGLRDAPEPEFIQKLLEKQGELLSEIALYASPIVFLIIVSLYSNRLFPLLGIGEELSTDSLQKVLIFLATVFMTGLFFGYKVEQFIGERINKFEEYPGFSITRGDIKSIEAYEKANKKITKQILGRFFWIIVAILLSSAFRLVIQYTTP